jgi:hypothetical protein
MKRKKRNIAGNSCDPKDKEIYAPSVGSGKTGSVLKASLPFFVNSNWIKCIFPI